MVEKEKEERRGDWAENFDKLEERGTKTLKDTKQVEERKRK